MRNVIIFGGDGIMIHAVNGESFRFSGSALDLISILIAHPTLDLDPAVTTIHIRPSCN